MTEEEAQIGIASMQEQIGRIHELNNQPTGAATGMGQGDGNVVFFSTGAATGMGTKGDGNVVFFSTGAATGMGTKGDGNVVLIIFISKDC
jgi:hypothetical protein